MVYIYHRPSRGGANGCEEMQYFEYFFCLKHTQKGFEHDRTALEGEP